MPALVAACAGALFGYLVTSGSDATSADHNHPHDLASATSPSASPVEIPVDLRITDRTREILSDGTVSKNEYEETMLLVHECAADTGSDLEYPRPDASGLLLEFQVEPDQLDAYDYCYEEHGRAIDIAYQTSPTTVAAIDSFYRSVIECADKAGVDLSATAEDGLGAISPSRSADELSSRDIVEFAVPLLAEPSDEAAVTGCLR
jgi:hypothetical protein